MDVVRDAEALGGRIGYVSEGFTLYGGLSVEENIDFFANLYKVPPNKAAKRKEQLLGFARMEQARARRAKNLSGGMKKKLASARTEAAIAALGSARDAAYQAWQAALDAQNNPQELDLKIAETQAQLDLAELQVQSAQLSNDPVALSQPKPAVTGCKRYSNYRKRCAASPTHGSAQVSQAEMFYQGLESLLQVGFSMQELLQIQQEKQTITAPRSGYIVERPLAEGEIAAPLAPLLVLADLTEMTLTTYLSAEQYGQVMLGDQVPVTVASLSGQVFTGTVTFISPNADFTPNNIQTQEERARLVYAVKISLDNPDLLLKPGMIAEASFGE